MEVRLDGRKLILDIQCDLTADRVKEVTTKAKESIKSMSGYQEIVLDVHNMTIMDSIGVSFVIGIFKTSKSSGKDFKIIGANKDIAKLFNLMNLDEVFEVR